MGVANTTLRMAWRLGVHSTVATGEQHTKKRNPRNPRATRVDLEYKPDRSLICTDGHILERIHGTTCKRRTRREQNVSGDGYKRTVMGFPWLFLLRLILGVSHGAK